MSSTNKPTGYLLNGPADWDAFERRYILKIGGERVAHLGLLKDPAEFHMKRKPEPVIPEISNYKKAELVTDQHNQSTFVRGNEPAAHYSDLHPLDLEELKNETQLYRYRQDAYKAEAAGIRNTLEWLTENTNPHYTKVAAPTNTELTEFDNFVRLYLKLKEACGIDEDNLYSQARNEYFEVLSAAQSLKSAWEDWISRWERAMQEGQRRGITETSRAQSWFEDLQRALKSQFDVFMRMEKVKCDTEIRLGTYQPTQFSSAFRQELIINQPKAKPQKEARPQKGSFNASVPLAEKPDKKRKANTSPKGEDRAPKKAKPKPNPELHCILCDRDHKNPNTASCWVAFPENMPSRFTLSEKQVEDWKARLKESDEARKLFNKLKTEKREEKTEND
jgi:hypothetical protein